MKSQNIRPFLTAKLLFIILLLVLNVIFEANEFLTHHLSVINNVQNFHLTPAYYLRPPIPTSHHDNNMFCFRFLSFAKAETFINHDFTTTEKLEINISDSSSPWLLDRCVFGEWGMVAHIGGHDQPNEPVITDLSLTISNSVTYGHIQINFAQNTLFVGISVSIINVSCLYSLTALGRSGIGGLGSSSIIAFIIYGVIGFGSTLSVDDVTLSASSMLRNVSVVSFIFANQSAVNASTFRAQNIHADNSTIISTEELLVTNPFKQTTSSTVQFYLAGALTGSEVYVSNVSWTAASLLVPVPSLACVSFLYLPASLTCDTNITIMAIRPNGINMSGIVNLFLPAVPNDLLAHTNNDVSEMVPFTITDLQDIRVDQNKYLIHDVFVSGSSAVLFEFHHVTNFSSATSSTPSVIFTDNVVTISNIQLADSPTYGAALEPSQLWCVLFNLNSEPLVSNSNSSRLYDLSSIHTPLFSGSLLVFTGNTVQVSNANATSLFSSSTDLKRFVNVMGFKSSGTLRSLDVFPHLPVAIDGSDLIFETLALLTTHALCNSVRVTHNLILVTAGYLSGPSGHVMHIQLQSNQGIAMFNNSFALLNSTIMSSPHGRGFLFEAMGVDEFLFIANGTQHTPFLTTFFINNSLHAENIICRATVDGQQSSTTLLSSKPLAEVSVLPHTLQHFSLNTIRFQNLVYAIDPYNDSISNTVLGFMGDPVVVVAIQFAVQSTISVSNVSIPLLVVGNNFFIQKVTDKGRASATRTVVVQSGGLSVVFHENFICIRKILLEESLSSSDAVTFNLLARSHWMFNTIHILEVTHKALLLPTLDPAQSCITVTFVMSPSTMHNNQIHLYNISNEGPYGYHTVYFWLSAGIFRDNNVSFRAVSVLRTNSLNIYHTAAMSSCLYFYASPTSSLVRNLIVSDGLKNKVNLGYGVSIILMPRYGVTGNGGGNPLNLSACGNHDSLEHLERSCGEDEEGYLSGNAHNRFIVRHVVITGNASLGGSVNCVGPSLNLTIIFRGISVLPGSIMPYGSFASSAVSFTISGPFLYSRLGVTNVTSLSLPQLELNTVVTFYLTTAFFRSQFSLKLLRTKGVGPAPVLNFASYEGAELRSSAINVSTILVEGTGVPNAFTVCSLMFVTSSIWNSTFDFSRVSVFAISTGASSDPYEAQGVSVLLTGSTNFEESFVRFADIELRQLLQGRTLIPHHPSIADYSKGIYFSLDGTSNFRQNKVIAVRVTSNATETSAFYFFQSVPTATLLNNSFSISNISVKLGICVFFAFQVASFNIFDITTLNSAIFSQGNDIKATVERQFEKSVELLPSSEGLLKLVEENGGGSAEERSHYPTDILIFEVDSVSFIIAANKMSEPDRITLPSVGGLVSPAGVSVYGAYFLIPIDFSTLTHNIFNFENISGRFGPLVMFETGVVDRSMTSSYTSQAYHCIAQNQFSFTFGTFFLTQEQEYGDLGFTSPVATTIGYGFVFQITMPSQSNSSTFNFSANIFSIDNVILDSKPMNLYQPSEIGLAAVAIGLIATMHLQSQYVSENIKDVNITIRNCIWDLPNMTYSGIKTAGGYVAFLDLISSTVVLESISGLQICIWTSVGATRIATANCSLCSIQMNLTPTKSIASSTSTITGHFSETSSITVINSNFFGGFEFDVGLSDHSTLVLNNLSISFQLRIRLALSLRSIASLSMSTSTVLLSSSLNVDSGSCFHIDKNNFTSARLAVQTDENCTTQSLGCLVAITDSTFTSTSSSFILSGFLSDGIMVLFQNNDIVSNFRSLQLICAIRGSAIISIINNVMKSTTAFSSQVCVDFPVPFTFPFYGSLELWGNTFYGTVRISDSNPSSGNGTFRFISNYMITNQALNQLTFDSTEMVPNFRRIVSCNVLQNTSINLTIPPSFTRLACSENVFVTRCTEGFSFYSQSGIHRIESVTRSQIASCLEDPFEPYSTGTRTFSPSLPSTTTSESQQASRTSPLYSFTIVATHTLPQNDTASPLIPVPVAVAIAEQVRGVAGVALVITAVASTVGGQLGVADAMTRLAQCNDDIGDEPLPVLMHPLRFSFGPQPVEKYAAGALSNTLLVPLIVVVVAMGPVRLLVMWARSVSSRKAQQQIGWPSLLVLPFANLAEGIGATITTVVLTGEPLGVGAGLVAAAVTFTFIGSWIWILARVVPRNRLELQLESRHHVPRREEPDVPSQNRRASLWRVVRPSHRWVPWAGAANPLTHGFVERYGNAVGDKRWYYADLLSFMCSVVVGVAEGLPATLCRERMLLALLPALAQCALSVLTLVPLERVLQSLLSMCLVPMYVVVVVKVFDGSGDDDTLDAVMAVMSSAGNVIGLCIMALGLCVGLWEMATTHRNNSRGAMVSKKKSTRHIVPTIEDVGDPALDIPLLEIRGEDDNPKRQPLQSVEQNSTVPNSSFAARQEVYAHRRSQTLNSQHQPLQRSVVDVLDFVERVAVEQRVQKEKLNDEIEL